MNTPSHFVITAALEKALPKLQVVKSAFLLGAVAPDLPLWLLSLGGIAYYHGIKGWDLPRTFHLMFDELYFYNPFWIGCHNLFHAPLILLLGLAIVWRKRASSQSRHRWWFWFLWACLLHSAIDIFTHTNDGPLLLFPLNWSLRFNSPISYWDPRYHGDVFQWFELGLDLVLLVYLINTPLRRYWQRWHHH